MSFNEELYRIEAITYLLSKGYPKENFLIEPIVKRFGNSGRNSFRSDFAVLKQPVSSYNNFDPDYLMKEVVLLCEVKRDNAKNEYVKNTQVRPMLDFAKDISAIGLYWDNLEHRVFWSEMHDGVRETREGPLSFLPEYGESMNTQPLTYATLNTPTSLVDIFKRIEDILHQASFSPEVRYEIILQLLLTKIFDEHAYETRPTLPLELQDYEALGISPELALKKYAPVVKRAVSFYEKHLPNPISYDPHIDGFVLSEVMKILAPVRIIDAKLDVIQNFYMTFAKSMYKWDMAQYFTPTSVTDFIVKIINPQFGEHIADPACGSADFLVAAFRIGRLFNPGFADCIWGVDNSPNAVQVAILNMVLNGDGKSNIKKDDSLQNIGDYLDRYDIILCNPPFGSKIVEKRTSVLRQFKLAYKPQWVNNQLIMLDELLESQESGILFIEACVKQCKNNGRVAIILPNGYLGNRSAKFIAIRKWLLLNTRVASIVSLPRFTFKSSGADVSASVVFLEKRAQPLEDIAEIEEYIMSVQLIEKLGWSAGDKKATPVYIRNEEDGSLVLDSDNNPIIDSDFTKVLTSLSKSAATNYFDWIHKEGIPGDELGDTSILEVCKDPYLTLDPKRYCGKYVKLRNDLRSRPHHKLGELVDFIPQMTSSGGKKIRIDKSKQYRYVQIDDIGFGDYRFETMRGWELPSRAKHLSENGDIFFGSIWGSAIKWCYIADSSQNVIITNGCFRVRMKPGMEKYLPDLLCYFNSEGWGVQMRAIARGSDGLAEICEDDAKDVLILDLDDENREKVSQYVDNVTTGNTSLNVVIKSLLFQNALDYSEPEKRPSHIDLV